jgi:PAS domain S-box-containing protein
VFDSSLRLVSANARYRELTGIDADQPHDRSVYDAFPNALADLTEQIDSAVDGTPVVALPVVFQHRGGRRTVEVTFTPFLDDAGRRGVIFAGNDITEREELRQDLARSVAQLESIFDVIPDSVRVVDIDGNTLRSNSQAQLDHAASQPATLRDLWQLDRPRTLEGTSLFVHEHPTARALRGERVRGLRLDVRRGPGGVAVIDVNANPLYDEQGRIRGAVTVERDITVRTQLQKQLEEEARRTAELYERVSTEAERLERMVQERTQEILALQEARSRERRLAAVGQLAAGVMHDVNNALNPIMAAAYLLETSADNPAAVRDYAVRIAKAAETGAATAARVGRFIRQEPMQGERDDLIDMSAVCDEVVDMTRPLWAERARGGVIQLDRSLAAGAIVRGITGEIREALLNLVQNALDAMHGGGTLGVSTRVGGGEVTVEIRDTGTGMSDEVRERAFEPFFTTKGKAGTGLGLAEVYGIAKRHRGRAEIDSTLGVGTTLRLVFPLATGEPDVAPIGPPTRRAPRRVLLVEDHVDSREFMQALLESDGHTVTAATCVEEAKAKLGHEATTPFDVLVSDVGLPDGSGWDLVNHIRARWPAMRLGIVTGWEPGGAVMPVEFLLRKPVRTADLLAQVAARDATLAE